MDTIPLAPALADRLRDAASAVVLTGAGVSRESGLSTFRGAEGLWRRFRPEELATPEAFARHPEVVWQWYAQRFRAAVASHPNPAHHAIARLAGLFPSFTLVTQNVDGLHQRAGSREVLELHGSLTHVRCRRCGTRKEMDMALEQSPGEPLRCSCGDLFRPDVVWFGEVLPAETLRRAAEAAERADLLVSVGTSARVFPAAGLIELAHRAGSAVVEVNPEETLFSGIADLRLRAPAGEALPALVEVVESCRRSDP